MGNENAILNNDPSMGQANHILNLILQKEATKTDVQYLLKTGILSHILDGVPLMLKLSEKEQKIRQAQIALAVGALTRPLVSSNFWEVDGYEEKLPRKNLQNIMIEKGVRYVAPRRWWTFETRGSPFKSRRINWYTITFPAESIPSSRFDPDIIIRAMGYQCADVHDLGTFVDTYKEFFSPKIKLVALRTKLIYQGTVETSRKYTAGHPGLMYDGQDLVFKHDLYSYDHMGLPSPEYSFLVRPKFN